MFSERACFGLNVKGKRPGLEERKPWAKTLYDFTCQEAPYVTMMHSQKLTHNDLQLEAQEEVHSCLVWITSMERV